MVKSKAKPTRIRRAERPGRGAPTRAAIIAAAEQVFAERGFSGARTDQIAAAARVNKALLYYYFRSKNALFCAVLEDHLREFNRRALAILDAPGPARTLLLSYVSMHFDFIAARPHYPRLFQHLALTSGRSFEGLAHKYVLPLGRRLTALIERGEREGDFFAADPQHTAISLAGLTVFYFSAAPVIRMIGRSDPYTAANLKRRKHEVLTFIRHALFRRPEAAAV